VVSKGEGSSRKAIKVTQSIKSTATSTKPVARSNSSSKMPEQTPSQEGSADFKVTKLSSTTVKLSSTSWTPPPPPAKAPPPPASQRQEPSLDTDPLHLAAQVYSWTYMSSTLDACFKSAEEAANKDLETWNKELATEEAEISEQRQRLDAQRAIEFYDELGSELFLNEVPAIMQQFHSHGNSCAKIDTEALNLAACDQGNAEDDEPLRVYSQMLDDIEELQNEAASLQNSITRLTEQALATPDKSQKEDEGVNGNGDDSSSPEANSARQQIISIFAACLPVLKARIANLSMAQELVDSELENARLSLQMESLGILH